MPPLSFQAPPPRRLAVRRHLNPMDQRPYRPIPGAARFLNSPLWSTAVGLSAADLARAARSSWAFFASAAVLRRSAKSAVLDLFISLLIRSRKRLVARRVVDCYNLLAINAQESRGKKAKQPHASRRGSKSKRLEARVRRQFWNNLPKKCNKTERLFLARMQKFRSFNPILRPVRTAGSPPLGCGLGNAAVSVLPD